MTRVPKTDSFCCSNEPLALLKMSDADLALIERHRQGPVHHFGRLIHFVRIDDERFVHHLTGTGERRYDQHAGVVDLTGDEFFGHEVHAVPQRRDDGDGGVPIESRQFGLLASLALKIKRINPSFAYILSALIQMNQTD